MTEFEAQIAVRKAARIFEDQLPTDQRKELGQFFTGMPLGRVLVHLALDSETRYLIDPMAGSGDLLDAAYEAAIDLGVPLQRLDGIEVDKATAAICDGRLRSIYAGQETTLCVLQGDAFDTSTLSVVPVPEPGYDLVVTNPPYVRYQSLNERGKNARDGLSAIIDRQLSGRIKDVWKVLVGGYSGLADLSIPAWILSALLVKPGGRLALVVPATWRSRAYADVIRYVLLRAFDLELVVEDTQPGWFSNALVRTHLIVARRLSDDEVMQPLSARAIWRDALWVQISPEAADEQSLVGRAFPSAQPEVDFARWCRDANRPVIGGVSARRFSLEYEWRSLWGQAAGRSWIKALEPGYIQSAQDGCAAASVPETLRDLLPVGFDAATLRELGDAGIHVGQGLRTGCNRFFYVRLLEQNANGYCQVEVDSALGGFTLSVPAAALQPVLHRQTDLEEWRNNLIPATRVLDLRRMVLPEDMDAIFRMGNGECSQRASLLVKMSSELAAHVRASSKVLIGNGKNARPVAELSAVRTNVRPARYGALPRFWYMLPDFKARHLPEAFVPRIIHGAPQVHANAKPPILIDANFSTFWGDQEDWTPAGLAAFLNSAWCRVLMEAVGTSLGGGALKLEAVHLRKLPVPQIVPQMVKSLNEAAQFECSVQRCRQANRIVLGAMLSSNSSDAEIDAFAQRLDNRRAILCAVRQRGST